MIIAEDKRWWRMALAIRGTTITRTWQRVAVTTLVACLATMAFDHGWLGSFTLSTTPFSLIGLALSIFLGFRNNASYDRYWEARKLWGALVNNSRTLTRQALIYIAAPPDAPPEEHAAVAALRERLVRRQIAFVHALRLHLRRQPEREDLENNLGIAETESLESEPNIPTAINHRSAELLVEAMRRGWLDRLHLPMVEACLTANSDIQGGCERILATPVPFIYNVLMHRIVAIYCMFLPFGLVRDLDWSTPVVVAMIAYAFYGLDSIGDEVEEPFGTDANDLPLSALSRMIEVNLRVRLGDTDLPPLHKPVDGVLR